MQDRLPAAEFTQRSAQHIRKLMNTPPRDFVTVDMRDLKAPLADRAHAAGRSVSDLVRVAVAAWLGQALPAPSVSPLVAADAHTSTVKLSIRLHGADARLLAERAQQAGVSRGALIGGLLAEVPVMTQATARPAEVLAAVVSSNAQVSGLCRQVSQLCVLLQRGDGVGARAYRSQLAGLVDEVRAHLRLTAEALDLLRDRHGRAPRQRRSP